MAELLDQLPHDGSVEWIGIRSARRQPVRPVKHALLTCAGVEGDHRNRPGKRAVTLIQAEHLAVIATLMRKTSIDPAILRRNIVVSGINLIALKGKRFQIGSAICEATGPCAPCSRMEEVLGPGGYNAMRGHGGITAEVIAEGLVTIGDRLTVPPSA